MSQENSTTSVEFTEFLLECGALKFGDFTLKSGRQSPYFINAGAFNSAKAIARLGEFYAHTILQAVKEDRIPHHIDAIFGPAYKGIPLAVSTSIALKDSLGSQLGYVFDRKEAKDHGDGGMMVGCDLRDGMNILLVDDVMTAGTAVRQVVPKLMDAAKVNIVGLVLCVDRMERAQGQDHSAVEAVQEEFGFPVLSIANIRQVFDSAAKLRKENGEFLIDEDLQDRIDAYMQTYGV